LKATSRPTSVAGADARDPAQQSWAMARLQELWECLSCTMSYVRRAMEILEDIWIKRDATMRDGIHTAHWIQDLKMSEIGLW
jgi:hypothetical protein